MSDKNLRCTFCGGPLHVETDNRGSGWTFEQVPDGFSCVECDGLWDVNGDVLITPTDECVQRAIDRIKDATSEESAQ